MLVTTVDRNMHPKMFNSTSNLNAKTSILDTTLEQKENMNYIKKFGLLLSVAQYINSQLILNNIYIDNSIVTSDIKFNLYVFHCFESYQLS